MKKPVYSDIHLGEPVTIGGKEVATVRLRRPSPGELRGVNLISVLQMNVDAVMEVVSRISEPALSKEIMSEMDTADFGEIAGELVFFFNRQGRTTPSPSGEDGPTT